MSDLTPGVGLLDTSVLIAPENIPTLPSNASISTLSLAELAAGPLSAADTVERSLRQERLQVIESFYDALPFDIECARAFGRIYAAVLGVGRKARGRRAVDMMIAATALANELPIYTRNAADFRGLESILNVVDCRAAAG